MNNCCTILNGLDNVIKINYGCTIGGFPMLLFELMKMIILCKSDELN